jgi:hypothetical protein
VYGAAFAALSGLPVSGGAWSETTNRPYTATLDIDLGPDRRHVYLTIRR